MKVTIKGITDSTIVFNTLGIIVRGNSNKNDSGSCAYHVDIDTVDRQNEINRLVNAKFITVESEEPIEHKTPIIQVCSDNPFDIVPVASYKKGTVFVDYDGGIEDCQAVANIDECFETDVEFERKAYENEYIEASKSEAFCENGVKVSCDIISTPNGQDGVFYNLCAEDLKSNDDSNSGTVEESKAIGKRGRPKGSKNVNGVKQKETISQVKKPIAPKKITKSSNVGLKDGSDVVVMTADGPRTGQMKRNAIGDINDSESTKASIEAMEELNREEKKSMDSEPIDESKLDLSDRMGLRAVVSCGEGNAQSVSMKNSVVPEAEQIKNRGINFIDSTEPENEDSLLIDENDADNDDDNGLDFLEY